jgi:hypothetical protein
MIQLQKVDLQIVGQCDGQCFFAESEVKVQLCGLPDQRPGQHANADRRPKVRVVLSLLQPSDTSRMKILPSSDSLVWTVLGKVTSVTGGCPTSTALRK